MKKYAFFLLLFCLATAASAQHRAGLGVNYWRAVKNVKIDDIDKSGMSYLLTYQWKPSLIGVQADFEVLPDYFGKDAYAPAAYLVVGSFIYAAAGLGMTHLDGGWADDPFLALKVGVDIGLPFVHLDVHANYRVNGKLREIDLGDELKKIGSDTVFLGAALRFAF